MVGKRKALEAKASWPSSSDMEEFQSGMMKMFPGKSKEEIKQIVGYQVQMSEESAALRKVQKGAVEGGWKSCAGCGRRGGARRCTGCFMVIRVSSYL